MKRRLVLLLLVSAWLLPALACNLPVSSYSAAPTVDVARSVRQTLEALQKTEPGAPAVLAATAAAQANAATARAASPAGAGETAVPDVDNPAATPQPEFPTPGSAPTLPPLPVVTVNAPTQSAVLSGNSFHYITQPGDTPAALALRFDVPEEQILDSQEFPAQEMLNAGQEVVIPNTLSGELPDPALLMPDSEVVDSPTTVGFSVQDYVQRAGGFLSTYSEPVDNGVLTGAQIVQRVAEDTSTDPRLLLAVLEYRSHWVLGVPADLANNQYPIGFGANGYAGLYKELTLTSRQLTIGYYGWRTGQVTELEFADKSHLRIHPAVNAGTAALQYLFSKLYNPQDWRDELYGPGRFLAFYASMFGDPWQRASALGPLLPHGLAQPALELPFPAGQTWTMTGGPHEAWGIGSTWGGLDFAPSSVEPGCTVSRFWATAAAPGLVTRSGNGEVIIDLDGDGNEQTGWVLLYLHMATQDRVPAGTRVKLNDPIGHPSCEGGVATGSHVHVSRKFNGEWIGADGPLPFVLSGWRAEDGTRPYSGTLNKNGQVVTARIDGVRTSIITR